MTMNKPAIDLLLAQIPSYYELTVAASQRAREIKIGNRDHPQPLQTSLEEVSEGKVEIYYEAVAAPIQAELALEAAPTPQPVAAPIETPVETPIVEAVEAIALEAAEDAGAEIEAGPFDPEMFAPAWRPLVSRIVAAGAIARPGGDIADAKGRVAGSYIAILNSGADRTYIVDESAKDAAKVSEALQLAHPESTVWLGSPDADFEL